ncbi:hypothetical protein [Acidiphilium acidophilum]|uniref:hypothetical protein n=1 Tax=Acidiphilium acidophilum TaxID=76588 RepID=UPI002E8E6C67|nr:hypothetical protein [Acidiphilium acidophilum]
MNPRTTIASNADARLIALCNRFTDLEHQKRAIYAAAPDSVAGDAHAAMAISPLHQEQDKILDLIVDIKAVTIEGLSARLRMIMVFGPQCIESPSNWDDYMVGSLLTDMQRVLAARD